jgi:hypothetical protein
MTEIILQGRMPEFLEVSSGSARRSFKRGYLSLLKKFDVAYDPRYLFEYAEGR